VCSSVIHQLKNSVGVIPSLDDEAHSRAIFLFRRVDVFHTRSNLASRMESGRYRIGGVRIEIADLRVRGSEQSEEPGNLQIHRHGVGRLPGRKTYAKQNFASERAVPADDAGTARPVSATQSGADHDRGEWHERLLGKGLDVGRQTVVNLEALFVLPAIYRDRCADRP
jgi:hypothetical protein